MLKHKKKKQFNQFIREEKYYSDGYEYGSRAERDRRKEKRLERALKIGDIRNIQELEDEGYDPEDYESDLLNTKEDLNEKEEDYRAYLQVSK